MVGGGSSVGAGAVVVGLVSAHFLEAEELEELDVEPDSGRAVESDGQLVPLLDAMALGLPTHHLG